MATRRHFIQAMAAIPAAAALGTLVQAAKAGRGGDIRETLRNDQWNSVAPAGGD